MIEDISSIVSGKEGPISMILVGVHGDELCGVRALEKILPSLQIERGTVYFGYGSPRAIASGTRFIERDLNRMFKPESSFSPEDKNTYEYERACALQKYFDKVEVLLDIHSNPWHEQETFVICEQQGMNVAAFLPTNMVVSGFDSVEPGGTDYYMNRTGKTGICFEAGYLDDDFSRTAASSAISSFLKARGHIENDLIRQVQSNIHIFQKGYSKTGNFQLSRPFTNFERLTKGELIGRDGEEDVIASKNCLILFAHNGYKPGTGVFLLGEDLGY